MSFKIKSSKAQLITFPKAELSELLLLDELELKSFFVKKEVDVFKFIDPYESDSSDIPHRFLDSLTLVNQSHFSQYKDLFKGDTLGVYFSHHNPTVQIERDTIILSNQADRWTIAHEMGHALIDKKRPLESKRNEASDLEELRNAKEDYEEMMSLYRMFGLFPSAEHIERALSSIEKWTTLLVNFLYMYELEEVRIEQHLQKMYREHPELKLDASSYKRSFWYANVNCTSAHGKYKNAVEVVDYFFTILDKENQEKYQKRIEEQQVFLKGHNRQLNELCPLK